jgi:diguanylate cyclase (GGDEF)-like protein/PAS domain S-box-containing protein
VIEKNYFSDSHQNDNRDRLDLIINAIGIGVWDWQVKTGQLTFNDRGAEMLGYTLAELARVDFNTWSKNLHPIDLVKAEKALKKHFSGHSDVYEIELQLLHKLGHYVWVLASGKVVEWDHNKRPQRMIGMHVDITERKRNENTLLVTSQLLNQSQKVARVGGWELDLKSGNLFWTDETYRLHDTSPEEFNPTVDAGISYFLPESQTIISKALDAAINHCVGYDLELDALTTNGRKIDVRTTCIVTQEDGIAVRLTGIFQDISEHKDIQRKLELTNLNLAQVNEALKHTAHYDSLTALPNRILLADRMQQAILKSRRNNKYFAIAFIDIDGFKKINDNHGHAVGDELLKKIGGEIKGALREGDTLSRIGGDEFVAIIDNLADPSESDRVLSRILESVSAPLVVEKKILNVSASIGVTLYPLDGGDPDHLLRHADQAMYIAKQNGKNCFHIFDIENDVAIKNYNEKLARIAQALSNHEFVLHYQPKVDLRNNNVIGVEALIRWDHPKAGLLAPAMFLPEVEHNVLGTEIGKWVIQSALKQLDYWQSLGIDIAISVNISPLHLHYSRFVAELKEYLSHYPNFKPDSLDFEIVESSALDDFELVSKVIKECKQLGVSFSIDDFGAGYSSLIYLKRLPVKYLKIDQSFVRDMLSDMDDKAIIEGIIELAKVFYLTVIAEGVETPEHGKALLSLGSYIAQGYGIARPIPPEALPLWLVNWKINPQLVDRSQ